MDSGEHSIVYIYLSDDVTVAILKLNDMIE